MRIMQQIKHIVVVAALVVPGFAQAGNIIVPLPYLDTDSAFGGTGISVTETSFSIDSTAFTIITGGTPNDIADQIFTLSSTSGSFDLLSESGTFAGNFSVGGGLLSGTFTGLDVTGNFDGTYDFDSSGLTYTSGSLKGGLGGGVISGASFAGGRVIAKIGEVAVVPVPAAIWLFGSGLLGLVGLARRKTA